MNKTLALVLIGIGLFIGGYFTGTKAEHNANEADKEEAQQTAIELHNAVAVVGHAVERETVQRTAKTEAVFNGIQLGVIDYAQSHPAATDCRLDDDGLRLWNAANANTDPVPAAERHADVQGTATSAERRDDGFADEPHRGGQGVSPVPGSAPGIDRLAGEN